MPELQNPFLFIDPTDRDLIFAIKQMLDRSRAEIPERALWQPPEGRNAFEEFYIVAVLEQLLLHNQVYTWAKAQELESENEHGNFCKLDYERACSIVSQVPGVKLTYGEPATA